MHSSPSTTSHARPEPSPTTVASVVQEAVRAVLDQHAPDVVHVLTPPPDGCGSTDDCLPLGPLLELDAGTAGHLHRLDDHAAADRPPPATPPLTLRVLGELIAAMVGRDLLDVRLALREHEITNLHVALDTNRSIGVAVGVLMVTHRCTASDAFALMKTASQQQNRKLRDIASEVQYTGVIARSARVAS